jgi:hypothetical protein
MTLHHQACIQELGRCTVMGCAQPITCPAEADGARPAQRAIRRRIRERAASFFRNRESRYQTRFLTVLVEAERAEREERYQEAESCYAELMNLWEHPGVGGSKELDAALDGRSVKEIRDLARMLRSVSEDAPIPRVYKLLAVLAFLVVVLAIVSVSRL